MTHHHLYINALVEAMPYMRQFRHQVVVIKCGGRLLSDEKVLNSLAQDIAFLRYVGIYPIVVHGGGVMISDRMQQEGLEVRFEQGLRYTCSEVLRIAQEELSVLNNRFCQMISQYGVDTWRYDISACVLQAERLLKNGQDVGFVGKVVNLLDTFFEELFNKENVPVIYPLVLGKDSDQVYNVNADMVASFIATSLQAKKLILLSDIEGVYKDENRTAFYSCLSSLQVKNLIDEGVIFGGMIPKVESAVEVVRSGVEKVHIVSGFLKHSLLLEVFTDEGVGTEIVI